MRGISKEFLSSTLKDFYGDDKTHAELEQIFSDANVNIEEKIDTVIDALYAEDANVEEVSQLIVDNIDEVYEALQTYNPEEYSGLFDEEAKADMKESVEEVLSNFADEEGNLNMDDMLAELLLEFLGSGSAASGARGQSAVFSKVSLFAQEPTTQADSKEELKTKLRAFLTDLIPKKTAEIIVMGLQAVGYLILFTFFTWGYLILKILVKMTMPVNTIKVGLPIWLGWLPYLFFALLPTALTSVLTDPSILASIDVGLAESVAAASGPLNAFSLEISFFSCAIVSFFVAIALALFVLVYYGSIRKKLKRIKNGTLVEDPPTPKHTNLEDTLTELNEDNIQIDEE